MKFRVFVVLVLAIGLALPGSAAGAVTKSTISIGHRVYVDGRQTSAPTAAPGEQVVFSGAATFTKGRVVVLQRYSAGAWREVVRRPAGSTWRIAVPAPSPGRHSYRALALRTKWSAGARSATRVLTVVRASISFSALAKVEAGRLLTVRGAAVPARSGHLVQLWEQRGNRWVPIADTVQSATGTYTMRIRAGTRGRHTYRAVTLAADGRHGVRSATKVVTTVGPSTPGIRSTYLADVTPLGALDDLYGQGSPYDTGTFLIGARPYPRSVRTTSNRFSYELGADASTFLTALTVVSVKRGGQRYKGPRLFELSVDGDLRLRRFVKDGQALPVRMDVRGKRVVTIRSFDSGLLDLGPGSDVLLGTPFVTSQVLTERSVDSGTALSELRPTARTGAAVATDQLVDGVSRTLYGGSLLLTASQLTSVTGSVEYDVGGVYSRLTGVPGVTGEASTDLTGRVRVFGDGTVLATLPARLDRRDLASVDITGVQRLRIELVSDAPTQFWNYGWYVAFADPRLT